MSRRWISQKTHSLSARCPVRRGRVPTNIRLATWAFPGIGTARPASRSPVRRVDAAARHAYPPGQVEVEVPGAQEAQQEGVGERQRRERGAHGQRPAPQLGQAGLQQRRVVGQRAQLQPGRRARPRPRLCHARCRRSGWGGPGCPEQRGLRATLQPLPRRPLPSASPPSRPAWPRRRAAHCLPQRNHVVSPRVLIISKALSTNLDLTPKGIHWLLTLREDVKKFAYVDWHVSNKSLREFGGFFFFFSYSPLPSPFPR